MNKVVVVMGEGGCVEIAYIDGDIGEVEVILVDFCNEEGEEDFEECLFGYIADGKPYPKIAEVGHVNTESIDEMPDDVETVYKKYVLSYSNKY